LAGRGIDEGVGGLDVLMDETVLVNLSERDRQSDSDAQELSHLHRRSNQAVERFASRVIEYEYGATLVSDEAERHNGPGRIQFGTQREFVLHSAKTAWRGVLPQWGDHERGPRGPVDRAPAPDTVKSEFPIVPERLTRPVRKL
jgi:hypothetical protein